jgi:hypothetical protein
MGRFGDAVDAYAKTTPARLEKELDVHFEHRVTHGTAGDAVRGPAGHSPNDSREFDPHTPTNPAGMPRATFAVPLATRAVRTRHTESGRRNRG